MISLNPNDIRHGPAAPTTEPDTPGPESCDTALGGAVVLRGTWCTCSTTTVSLPTGDIIVLTVSGELELGGVALLHTTLTCLLDRAPDHLIVDLADVRFCGARGLRLLVAAENAAAENGMCYTLSASSPHLSRIWTRLWPTDELPVRFPTTASAVTAAHADLAGSWGPNPWWDRSRYHRATDAGS